MKKKAAKVDWHEGKGRRQRAVFLFVLSQSNNAVCFRCDCMHVCTNLGHFSVTGRTNTTVYLSVREQTQRMTNERGTLIN